MVTGTGLVVVVVVVAGGLVVDVVEVEVEPDPLPEWPVVVVTGGRFVVVVTGTGFVVVVVVVVVEGRVVGTVATGALGRLAAYATSTPDDAAAVRKTAWDIRRTRARRRSRC